MAIEVEQVEPEGSERQFRAHAVKIKLAAEPAHGDLEWLRTAFWCEAEDFAFDDEVVAGHGARGRDNLGNRAGDIVQVAGEDSDLVAGAVNLYAGAIKFVFERGLAEIGEGFLDAFGGLREHRLYGAEEVDVALIEGGRAGFVQEVGHVGHVAGHHDGAPDAVGRGGEGFGEGFQHDAFERALAQLAEDQGGEKRLLSLGGAGEEGIQQVAAAAVGAGTGDAGERFQGLIHVADFEGGVPGRSGCGVAERGVSDVDAVLQGAAGEKGHDGVDLIEGSAAKESREQVDLFQALRGLGDAVRDFDEVMEQHLTWGHDSRGMRGSADSDRTSRMPDGKLTLHVLDVFGKPVTEKVDVLMNNQTLSDAPAFRDLDVSGTRVLTGLNVFPNGRYRLEVDGLSYHTVSRFINIPPDGNGEVTITLPVNPKKVLRAEFPEFGARTVPEEAWALLERSSNVLAFEGKTGETLYDVLDDIRKAGFLNLVSKANRTRFSGQPDGPKSVLAFVEELVELRGDRFFALAPPQLRTLTVSSVHDQLFHEVSELLHTPPAGFASDRSFKTMDHFGNLQLSFFESPDGQVAVDMDIDDAQGFDHIFQVVGNFFGGPTHPYNIHEILIADQELDPGYRLVVRENATAVSGAAQPGD